MKSRNAGLVLDGVLYAMTSTHAVDIQLTGDFLELCQLLKVAGIADSGGQGKHIVAAGEVRVDGALDLHKPAKI